MSAISLRLRSSLVPRADPLSPALLPTSLYQRQSRHDDDFSKIDDAIEASLTMHGEAPETSPDTNGTDDQGIDTAVLATSVAPGSTNDDTLKEIVLNNVDNARLLSNVGTEMSFQLPLGAASSFGPMFKKLDKEVDQGKIVTYGVSVTTLDEVFLVVARGDSGDETALASSMKSIAPVKPEDESKSVRSRMNLEKTGLFSRHVRALFEKRALNFKRDKKAWCCSVFLPSIFVLLDSSYSSLPRLSAIFQHYSLSSKPTTQRLPRSLGILFPSMTLDDFQLSARNLYCVSLQPSITR